MRRGSAGREAGGRSCENGIATDEILQRRCRQRAWLELQRRRAASFSNDAKKLLVLHSCSAATAGTAEYAPREGKRFARTGERCAQLDSFRNWELSARNR